MTSTTDAPTWHARVRAAAWVLVALFLAGVVASVPLFVAPATDEPRPVDALVVLGGGDGERAALAREVVDAGLADQLVLSYPGRIEDLGPNGFACDDDVPVPTLCIRPEPATTAGEAAAIVELADTHGWQRVAVVTSRYHVTRTRLLVERCLGSHDVEVDYLGARYPTPGPGFTARIVHEWVGIPWALTFGRAC